MRNVDRYNIQLGCTTRLGGLAPARPKNCAGCTSSLLLAQSKQRWPRGTFAFFVRGSRFAVICASRFTFVLRDSRFAVICASHFTFVLCGLHFLIRGSYFHVHASQVRAFSFAVRTFSFVLRSSRFALSHSRLVLSRSCFAVCSSQFTDRPCPFSIPGASQACMRIIMNKQGRPSDRALS